MLNRALLAFVVTQAALLAAGGAARAAPLRVLVLVGGEQDRDLAARIEGQAADLDAVVTAGDGVLPATLEAQFAVARAAAGRADAVVWFGSDGGDRVVYVARGERVLVRRVGGAAGALSRSASLEMAALAVRTALRGLAAGAELGNDEGDATSRRVRGWAELGWSGVLDGEGARGHHGVAVRCGGSVGRFRLGAALELQPAVSIGAPPATIQLERQEGGVIIGAEVLASARARWSLAVELRLGVVRFNRVTTGTDSTYTATASRRIFSPVAGPALRAGLRLTTGAWLVLGLGADVLARPPEFGVAGAAGFVRVAALRVVEPRATLALGFESP